jgi:hypothetical protein
MMRRNSIWYFLLTAVATLIVSQSDSFAYDIKDKFSIGGIIAGAYQNQWLDDDAGGEADDNIGRGAIPFQPEFSNVDITALGMNIGENDDGNNYNYFAAQVGYKMATSLGEGNYRLIVDTTGKKFLDEDGNKERRLAGILSFD